MTGRACPRETQEGRLTFKSRHRIAIAIGVDRKIMAAVPASAGPIPNHPMRLRQESASHGLGKGGAAISGLPRRRG